MRKLIIIGIVSVVVMIAWISYLKYDENRFKKEIGSSPISEQQINGTAPDTVETRATEDPKNDPLEQGNMQNAQSFSQEKASENIMPPLKNNADAENSMGTGSPEQTAENTGISPMLQKMFTEIHPYYQQIEEINRELIPLHNLLTDNSDRQQEILFEQAKTTDAEKKRELHAEFAANTEFSQKIGPTVLKLQDEVNLLGSEVDRILNEYGFESEIDFYDKHWNTYESWKSEQ